MVILSVVILVVGIIYSVCNLLILPRELFINGSTFYMFFNILIYLIAYMLIFIGIPSFLLIYIYELFSLGVVIPILLVNFKYSSLIVLIPLLFFKTVIVFMLILNTFYYFKYLKHIVNYLFKRIYISKHNIKLYIKKITIISAFLVITNIVFSLINMKMLVLLSI